MEDKLACTGLEQERIVSSGTALARAVVVIGLTAAPAVYAGIAYRHQVTPGAEFSVLAHIAANLACNIAVVVFAWSTKGRFDQKLSSALKRLVFIHGLLATSILLFRMYYSIPVLMASLLFSAVLGFGAIFTRAAGRGKRIAVVGGDRHSSRLVAEAAEITAPEGDLRGYDLALMAFPEHEAGRWAALLTSAVASGTQIRHLSDYLREEKGAISLEHIDPERLAHTRFTTYRFGKRCLDLAIIVIALPIILPITAIAALAIYLTMGGPALFVQTRVGLGGEPFRIYKLRTMTCSDRAQERATGAGGDVRITRLGSVLRRYRIDELPQLLNVLIGNMSIVGPRPEQPSLAAKYTAKIPLFAYRQMVPPGITGWAQVNSDYAADEDESRIKLAYDLFYLSNISFSLDLDILLRTFWTVLMGRGAR